MWYNIDYKKLVILMLPTFLRKPVIVAYLQSLIAPIVTIHDLWKEKRIIDWYKLDHTGQVCKLRKVLNDALDPSERRIYIGDGNSFPRKYIYTRAENKPTFLGKIYVYQNAEYIGTGSDFIVYVPQEIIDTEINKLNALIIFYKLASKRYQIRPI
jgi:hypothetical protein